MNDGKAMNDGGPAFPMHAGRIRNGALVPFSSGMTLRQYFAIKALEGMIASSPLCDRTIVDKKKWARVAYEFADAMIAERSKA